jgi:hypothetical protein
MAAMATLAGDLARALDPALLANAAGIEPDAWQADLLRSGAKQIILNCSRQVGKSTICSILALHDVLYTPPALVLVLSPSQRQSAELFNKIKKSYFKVTGGAARQDSAISLELSNGSRIVSLPGNEATVRGFSGVTRLIVDEASKVPDPLYQAVRPMLAVSSGSIALLSSPFGKRGFFHQVWSEGEDWERYFIPATMCPRIDPAWLAAERKAIGEFWFQQEYCGAFLEAQDSVFRFEDIEAMFDTDARPMFTQEQFIYPAGPGAGDEDEDEEYL